MPLGQGPEAVVGLHEFAEACFLGALDGADDAFLEHRGGLATRMLQASVIVEAWREVRWAS